MMNGIDYAETGSGPAILFIPGSYSTHAAWRPIQKLVGSGFRTVGTSLCGYGATLETRSREDCEMQHEVRVVEEVARRAGEPVHLVGHSFGATVALAASIDSTIKVASLALFEANPFDLLREPPHEMLYERSVKLSYEFEAAVDAGEVDAPARIIDFWGGMGTFAAMPETVRNYCRKTSLANALDWRTDFGFQADRDKLAALNIPVLLVRGALANPAMIAMTGALTQAIPDSKTAVVPEAGHFLITSHPRECAVLLTTFLAEIRCHDRATMGLGAR